MGYIIIEFKLLVQGLRCRCCKAEVPTTTCPHSLSHTGSATGCHSRDYLLPSIEPMFYNFITPTVLLWTFDTNFPDVHCTKTLLPLNRLRRPYRARSNHDMLTCQIRDFTAGPPASIVVKNESGVTCRVVRRFACPG